MPTETRKGNGPVESVEHELAKLTRGITPEPVNEKEHPALAACRKAAEMVRNVHKAHSEQSETLAQHIEHIGETFSGLCKEAAERIRNERILPQEMSNKTADELEEMGKLETERQLRVAHGLRAARDAIIGIDGGTSGTVTVNAGGAVASGATVSGQGGGQPERRT